MHTTIQGGLCRRGGFGLTLSRALHRLQLRQDQRRVVIGRLVAFDATAQGPSLGQQMSLSQNLIQRLRAHP